MAIMSFLAVIGVTWAGFNFLACLRSLRACCSTAGDDDKVFRERLLVGDPFFADARAVLLHRFVFSFLTEPSVQGSRFF